MRTFWLAAVLSITAVAGCSKLDQAEAAPAADKTTAKLPSMTVDEVDRALAANQAKAVDCNSEMTRKKMGVVPGAILAHAHHRGNHADLRVGPPISSLL